MHRHLTQPALTPGDVINKAAHDLIQVLKGKHNWAGQEQKQDLKTLSEVFRSMSMKAKAAQEDKERPDPRVKKAKSRGKDHHPSTKGIESQAPEPRVQEAEDEQAPRVQANPEHIVETAARMPNWAIHDLQALDSGGIIPTGPQPAAPEPKPNRQGAVKSGKSRGDSSRGDGLWNCPSQKAAVWQFPRQLFHEMTNVILDKETGDLLQYRQLLNHTKYRSVWRRSGANEYGRLAQGVGGRIKSTNMIFFIHKLQVPRDRFLDCTYPQFVCNLCPQKA